MAVRSHRSFVLATVLLLIILLMPWSFGYSLSFFDSLSLSLEKQIGAESYQDIISKKTVVQLPKDQQDHLNNIFNNLVNASYRKNELQFTLTMVQDDTINAFALPGGYVFLQTGLLAFAENDGEIAGVLAHEIAHIDRRHSMQAIGRSIGYSLLLQLVLSKSASKEQLKQIGGVAINLTQLGYSRENEFEADQYGVTFMTHAGYTKKDLANFFRKLDSKYGGDSSPASLQFLSTHPPTSERIQED